MPQAKRKAPQTSNSDAISLLVADQIDMAALGAMILERKKELQAA